MNMRRSLWWVFVAVLLVGMVVTVLSGFAAASASQYWKLDSEYLDGVFQMERVGGPGDDGQSGSVTIPSGGSKIWIADEAAAADVTFPEGDWVAYMCLGSGWADKCSVEVGVWDENSLSFSAFSVVDLRLTWDSNKKFIEVKTQTGSETIPEGQYLALKVINNDAAARPIQTNGCSSLTSPCKDPGYPTPQLATAVSLGAGVLGLSILAALRRRKETASAAS